MRPQVIGKVLANRYEILARVGEGGMAVVYRARDTLLGRMVAVKVLHPQYANDVEFIERFRREAQNAASLSHPNVVNIYDVGRDGDTHYIVMEYVEGRNLKEIIRQEGPLPWRTAVFIAIEICRALEAAHRHNLIHRDIKPHNILITRQDGNVKVTDFGIARATATSSLTHTGTVIGSVHYLAPEQARGDAVGTTADIYSLGVVLYEMVTGKVPFTGENPWSIALKHQQEEPPAPRSVNPQVPLDVERIIRRAMGKTVAERYPTAAAMLRDLRVIVNEPASADTVDDDITQPFPAVPSLEETALVPPVKTSRPPRRSRRKAGGGKWIFALILLSFAAGLLWAGARLPGFLRGEEVSVPAVVGREYTEAEDMLRQKGLRVERRDSYHPTVQVNYIIEQNPAGGRRIQKNGTVILTVSRGAELVTVPDVIGLDLATAQTSIQNAGLSLGQVQEEERAGNSGLVLKQTPAGGSRLARQGKVDITISKSATPVARVTVPDLSGLTVDAAKARLAEAGLKIGRSYDEEDVSGRREPGTIIDQSLPAGSEAVAGTAVDVAYARAPNTRTVNVTVNVPEGAEHEVKVTVVDELGERPQYGPRRHPGGAAITVPVTVRQQAVSVQRKYRIYIDGKLFDEGRL